MKEEQKETKLTGYKSRRHGVPTKRYCRTLETRSADPEFLREYYFRHSREGIWPEILEGIKSVGILEMEIYILGNKLFMIMETPLDFDWDEAMERLSKMPRQQEWEDYMSTFQDSAVGSKATEKWELMDRMFYLYD